MCYLRQIRCHLKERCLRYCVLDIRKESQTGEFQATLWLRRLIGHFLKEAPLKYMLTLPLALLLGIFLQIGLKQNLQLPCLLFFLLIAHISEIIIFSLESSYQSFLIDCLKRPNTHFLCQAGPESFLGSSASFLPHVLIPSWTILAPVVLIPLTTDVPQAYASRLVSFLSFVFTEHAACQTCSLGP